MSQSLPISADHDASPTQARQWSDHGAISSALSADLDSEAARFPRAWQVSNAIAGTAVVSAGLAMPFAAEPALGVPDGEVYAPAAQTLLSPGDVIGHGQSNYWASGSMALNQGEGVSPQVMLPGQAAFSQNSALVSDVGTGAYSPVMANAGTSSQSPTLTRKSDGSWSLAYDASAQAPISQAAISPSSTMVASAQDRLPTRSLASSEMATQTIVSQLAREAVQRTESVCLDNSCKGLAYVQAQLPEAKQAVQDAQQKLDAFVAQHGQSDMAGYQRVLSDRIGEVTSQKGEVAIELRETQRYIAHLKSRLEAVDVSVDLASHLLGVDAGYQSAWSQLTQTERRLLEEFSGANVDATALNRIYNRYEQQQVVLYESAQAVLGNYLLPSDDSSGGGSAALKHSLYQTPAVLDVLQALIVSLHQEETQQLRQRTLQTAESRLQGRHRSLARNMSEYESLQRDVAAAEKLVVEYEKERDRIAAEAASAAPLIARSAESNQRQLSPVFASAALLEARMPEGSTAKAILGIVLAAGAVAVASARQSGGSAKGLSLEILPNRRRRQFGFTSVANALSGKASSANALPSASALSTLSFGHSAVTSAEAVANRQQLTGKRQPNPVKPDLLAELLSLTNSGTTSGTSAKRPMLSVSKLDPNLELSEAIFAPPSESSLNNRFSVEAMSRELNHLVAASTPEARFADEVDNRSIVPVQLPLAKIDAFAERAVLWVLKDLSSVPATSHDSTLAVDTHAKAA